MKSCSLSSRAVQKFTATGSNRYCQARLIVALSRERICRSDLQCYKLPTV